MFFLHHLHISGNCEVKRSLWRKIFTHPNPSCSVCQCCNQNRTMETKPTEISSGKMFGGYNKRFKHFSPTLGCSMNFHIYFPPSPSPSHKFPVSPFHFFSFRFIQIQLHFMTMLPFCESKGSVLAVWPHMHRRELHNQGWCSTRRCC